jgi:hypothetical protein
MVLVSGCVHGFLSVATDSKIVVEALIPAPVELVWERTQVPAQHVSWDIRFTDIAYRSEVDARGFRALDYRTDVAFGIAVSGIGRYLHSTPFEHSTFEFDSDDWKSIIRNGRGVWLYERRPEGTFFKTVYDYDRRYGILGRVVDALLFRRLLQLATEWGFETLRLWCAGHPEAVEKRRSRSRFLLFYMRRLFYGRPAPGAARSWLGSGRASSGSTL